MAGIRNSDRIYVEELAGNQPRNLMVLCERLFLEFHDDSTPQEMAGQIARKLQEEPMLIGEMLKEEAVDLLFALWQTEEDAILPEQHLEELQQLHYLGFVSADEKDLLVNRCKGYLLFFHEEPQDAEDDGKIYRMGENYLWNVVHLWYSRCI